MKLQTTISTSRRALLTGLALWALTWASGCGEQAIEGIEYGADQGPDPFIMNGEPNNDVPDDPEPEMVPDPAPDVLGCVNDSDCDGGLCVDGECFESGALDCDNDPGCEQGDPEEYDFEVMGSFLSSIAVETSPSIGADLDGDGNPDNAFGGLFLDLGSILPMEDINDSLASAITSGELLMGATWPGLDESLSDGEGIQTHLFRLEAIEGGYLASRDSFISDSRTPASRFEGTLEGGLLISGPTDFVLPFSGDGFALDVTLSGAYLSGVLSTDEAGVAMAEGTLAGAVGVPDFMEVINDFLLSENCACLGLDGPMIDVSLGAVPEACVGQFDGEACASEGMENTCAQAASTCDLFVPLIYGQADLDLDGDGSLDALSAFVRIQMRGADIVGVAD